MNFEGKTVLVTGGRQGIGAAIVSKFHHLGANVITCGRGLNPEDLNTAITWFQCDVSDINQVNRLTTQISDIDVLVNNAGCQIEKTVLDTTDEDWKRLIGVNAFGVFAMCRAFIPKIRAGGSIINIGSISGETADIGLAIYNASKAFVHGLTRSIAVDHGDRLRCNAICPGWIMTDMAEAAFAVANDPQAAQQDALARHPAGRFGKPEDIANMAAWLASDEAGFATGQLFTVDGGMTAASPLNPGLF